MLIPCKGCISTEICKKKFIETLSYDSLMSCMLFKSHYINKEIIKGMSYADLVSKTFQEFLDAFSMTHEEYYERMLELICHPNEYGLTYRDYIFDFS